MPKEPFLPLFFGDFLAATAFWTGEEQALYLLLLGYQWSSGPLPVDLIKLAQVARYEPKRFQVLWKQVGGKFVATSNGLVNQRLEVVRAKSHLISEQNASAGKKGAAARWRKDGERHSGVNGKPMANAIKTPLANGMAPRSSSIPNKNEEEESEACQGQERRIPS